MSAFSEIARGVAEAYSGRDAETLRRTQAKQLQQQTEMAIERAPAQQELELATLKKQTYDMNASLLQANTFSSFDKYEADGDSRHLNTFIAKAKQNPVGASFYSTISRVDSLSKVRSPETDNMLRQAGIVDIEGFYSDPDLVKGYVLSTDTEGNQNIVDMETLYAMTGYSSHVTDKQLAEQEKRARINSLMRGGQSLNTVQQREKLIASIQENNPNLPYEEAFKQAQTIIDGEGSTDTKGIQQVLADNPGISYEEAASRWYKTKKSGTQSGATDQSRFIENYMNDNPGATETQASAAYANRTLTSGQKEVSSINAAKDSLDSIKFFDTPIGDMSRQDRANVHRYIAEIEDLRGVKLSQEDKRAAKDIRNLRALGGTAAEQMTPEQTGLIDSTLNSFKKYLFNEVGGKEGTAAYETFRNTFRNALYGASLTDSEIKAFNKAAGTLGQKFKPVMVQLKVQIESMKNQLQAVYDANDPYLAHFYFGADLDDIDDVIRQLETRLDYVDGMEIADVPKDTATTIGDIQKTAPPVQDGAPRRSLDDIFNLGGEQ